MILADSIVLQLDLGQTIALVGAIVGSLPTAAAVAAKLVIGYLKEKDKIQAQSDLIRDQQIVKVGEAVASLASTVQEVAERKDVAVQTESAHWREQMQKIVDGLVDLNKESIKTMVQVQGKITEVSTGQDRLTTEVRHLAEEVSSLGMKQPRRGQQQ